MSTSDALTVFSTRIAPPLTPQVKPPPLTPQVNVAPTIVCSNRDGSHFTVEGTAMFQVNVRNVNHALRVGLDLIRHEGEQITVRGQSTLELPSPTVTTYFRPTERVLFSMVRDANHFFHFFDALWILAGRQDVAFLKQFNSTIDSYSDDGWTFHGAYGERLRYASAIDQIDGVVRLLKADPTTRRATMTIWRPFSDLERQSKDIPCNVALSFLLRNGMLDMTVFCRSNDIVWGAYGANAVQFSMLHEVIAGIVGVKMGYYRQISNSYHAYNKREDYAKLQDFYEIEDLYEGRREVKTYPMVKRPESFLDEVRHFCADPSVPRVYQNPFFEEVARPLYGAWTRHQEAKEGLTVIGECQAEDWRLGCWNWLSKRESAMERKCQKERETKSKLATSTSSGVGAGSGDSTP